MESLSDLLKQASKLIKNNEGPLSAVGSAAAGAGLGAVAVSATGFTAAGMVGGGAGIGMAAGPLGVIAGAISGLAVYGVYKAFEPKRSNRGEDSNQQN